ncbi:LOW QUALITY PROTEIN: protein lethal(2)k10201-like [Choristoneura fumiferana]|uniref:LOW QUALITY PROTEIN: protein lethal(2)k10201-like n=1 Tax=Choristoneura fumiferana TaxID=7141 RepID=UPI003D155F0D
MVWKRLCCAAACEHNVTSAAKMEVKRLISPEVLRQFGCGHRKLNDVLFKTDPALPRLGVRDLDDEELCHEVISSTCNIPGCGFTADSLLEFESHYNSSHRYSCSQCKKVLPSPHLLDLHLQEQHDSFFAVLATRKPSYCCYIEECKEKFMNAKERLQHCVDAHKMPKDFRFDHKPKPKKAKNKNKKQTEENLMDLHGVPEQKQFYFNNKKHKTFAKYTGKKFTTDKENSSSATDVNMDEVVNDLKSSLPT